MVKNDKISDGSIKIFDINVFSNHKEELLNVLTNHLSKEKTLLTVMTPNPEQIMLSRSNSAFLHHLQSADLCLPDGIGLVLASKLLDKSNNKSSIKERISGKEVAAFLLDFAQKKDLTVLVIGGRGYGVAASQTDVPAEIQLAPMIGHKQYQKAFWLEGYADVQKPTTTEEALVTAALRKIKPDIVFVAFGAPYQEEWLITHMAVLEAAGTRVGIVVGGAFDVLLGKIPSSPGLITVLGLEWLYRLLQEPWRWRRQLKLLKFIKLTIRSI